MRIRTVALLGCAALAAGCGSVGSLAGAAAGMLSSAATANPAVGIAIGIGTNAIVDESIDSVLRYWSHEQQAQMAALIGTMGVGQQQPWEVRHSVPFGNEKGNVTVVRAFDTALTSCKEVAFSVHDSNKTAPPQRHYITSVCKGSNGWQWAQAEPAVARWGALQ